MPYWITETNPQGLRPSRLIIVEEEPSDRYFKRGPYFQEMAAWTHLRMLERDRTSSAKMLALILGGILLLAVIGVAA